MKLFWKLFITVGVAMAFAVVAAASMGWHGGRLTMQAFIDYNAFNREAQISRSALINQAGAALNRGGRDELTDWLRSNESPAPGYTLYIVDPNDEDLLGREIPDDANPWLNPSWFSRDRPDGERGFRNDDNNRGDNRRQGNRGFGPGAAPQNFRAQNLTDDLIDPYDQQIYRMLFFPSSVTLLDVINFPATRMGIATLAVLLAAATALLLAKSLSSPIVRLQRATRGLAQGALDTRVGSPINRRRDEVGTLARDFDTMAERVQALITDKEVLLRDVSHELRSPLARIRVALALAERKAGPDAQSDLDRIDQETERLDQLVGQILTLAKLRSSKVEHDTEVDLNDIVGEVVANARFEHNELEVVFNETRIPKVRGDGVGLTSAIENVLRNALMHSGSDVEVTLRPERSDVVVTIADHGPGVPEEDLKRLFEPFYRVDPSRDHSQTSYGDQQSGYGLGLAIAASIIEQHHGSVEAENRPGGGLAVTFRLPAGT